MGHPSASESVPIPGSSVLAELVPDQIWAANPDGSLVYVNARVLSYFGRDADEILKAGWTGFVHPEDLPAVLERWRESIQTGTPYEVEFRLRRHDGVYRWHIARALMQQDDSGVPIRWVGSNTDVDDQRRAEEALRAREEREHFLAEASLLLTTSLADYRTNLQSLASLAIPRLGDLCFFDVLDDDGRVRRVAWHHDDPEVRPWFDDVLRMVPPRTATDHPVARSLERGEAVFVPEVTDEWMQRAATNPGHLEFMRRLAFHSLITLPLQAPGGIVGAVTLCFSRSDRRYTDADLNLAQALASRAGVAIENARLFEAVRQGRERLQASLQASGTGTFRWDIRTDALDWDEELDRLFGLPPGRSPRSLAAFVAMVHPEDRQAVIDACTRCADEGADFEAEFRAVWPDGTVRWLRDTGKTTVDEDGPSHLTGACIDITERRLREEELRALADSLPQLAWMADPEGWIFWYNRRWFAYTGTTLEQMQGWGWKAVHHPDHVDRVVTGIQRSWDTGEPWEDTFPLRGRDGEYRWFLSRALPVRGPDGGVTRWFGTNTDITELRAAETARDQALAEADRANRAKSEFLAAMSHDLRTPLNAIGGYSHLVQEGVYGAVSEGLAEAMGRIRRASEHLLTLVNDILSFARLEAGSIPVAPTAVDVDDLLADVYPLLKPQIEARGLEYRHRRGRAGVCVHADRERATQILANLLTNAVKFTERGSVSVEWDHDDAEVRIHVRDTGAGIPADRLADIFEPFVQQGEDRDSRAGVGLGLAIGRQLARLMGGDLTVTSTLGHGSTFTLTLPRSVPA